LSAQNRLILCAQQSAEFQIEEGERKRVARSAGRSLQFGGRAKEREKERESESKREKERERERVFLAAFSKSGGLPTFFSNGASPHHRPFGSAAVFFSTAERIFFRVSRVQLFLANFEKVIFLIHSS
jgi:hypothetical protein